MEFQEAPDKPLAPPSRQAQPTISVLPNRAAEAGKMASSSVIAEIDRALARRNRGPNVSASKKKKRNYLLQPAYRQISLPEIYESSEQELNAFLERIRWNGLGAGVQACPKCGSIDTHYRCPSIGGWKCKGCTKQFTVLSGTRLHGMKMPVKVFLSIAMLFMEAKDGKSSRELGGDHGLDHQTVHVLTLKIREALRETLSAEEPLRGYIQADAAYFMKYVRPGNVGTGAALAAKAVQKNAGLSEEDKPSPVVNASMHALVVFVQAGPQGKRRYRMGLVKTENQVDLLTLSQQFCDKDSVLVTDQHSAYNLFSGEFVDLKRVNHNQEFQTQDGVNTNLAENIFSRIRAAVHGAWHRMSVQNLLEYGWEVAWRQEMVGKNNLFQLEDLLRRLMTSGRPTRFVDYWNKRPEDRRPPKEEIGELKEVAKTDVPKKRGRPTKGSARPQKPVPAGGKAAGVPTEAEARAA